MGKDHRLHVAVLNNPLDQIISRPKPSAKKIMNVISLVSYPFLPAKSGGQKGIAIFYAYFSRFHSVTVAGSRMNEDQLAKGYALKKIFGSSPLRYVNPFLFFSLRRIIIEKKGSHLILEHPYFGWLGIWLKKNMGIQLVIHSHNIEAQRWKTLGKWWWRILWHYEKYTHRKADYNYFIQDVDRQYAIEQFGLNPVRCLTVPFGTTLSEPPDNILCSQSKETLCSQLQIPFTTPLFLFNGAFNYAPNRNALADILYKVNPALQEQGIDYLLIIIGLDIPENIRNAFFPSVRILGFVENLELYLTGCDLFLNPVVSGGGIKTKLVEALAYNLNAVSSSNGAIGIHPDLCNGKLVICRDNDWPAFIQGIKQAMLIKAKTPSIFYDQFYWENITRKAAEFIR